MTTELSSYWTDAGLLSPVRVGSPVEEVTTDAAWLQALLAAEAALIPAQARLGLVPERAAEAISALARAERLPLRELAERTRGAANPVVSVVQAFTAVVAAADPQAADYVHRGSTSQDILDTAAMLVTRRAGTLLLADLDRVAAALAGLAERHRDTPMAGRTLGLHAVPTTFGLKAAGWLQAVTDAAGRLRSLLEGGLPVELGGAAGTLAGYVEYARIHQEQGVPGALDPQEYARRLIAGYAAETGLSEPVLPWHAVRTPVAETGSVLALVTGALGKIAVDVQVLCRTEIAELAEPAAGGRGVSSAMPHKRNPALATLIRSAALQVPPLAMVLAQSMVAEDERSAGVWHAEWLPMRECLRLAGGAAHTAVELVEGLQVFPERMGTNLELTRGLLVSERIAAVLTPVLGKDGARKLMDAASAEAAEREVTLGAVLAEHPRAAELFDAGRLADLLDPAQYTGAAGMLVDRALAHYRGRLHK
ncbi:adenylosuccinate lyase family protein [Kitasatospora nipponensis]|uniref:Adenylosuccinate lyase family protein n=1 Tax=Kitasatospora nipponensis TaxID=258049 RepID=A0ABN1WZH1_9ACTN